MQKLSAIIPKLLSGGTLPENTALLSVAEKCVHCGRPVEPLRILGRRITPACSCQSERYAKEEAQRRQEEKKARIENIFNGCGLGPRFAGCSFENWQQRPGTEKTFLAARQYAGNLAENIKQGRGLLFFGPPGSGKSHLMAAVVNTAIIRGYTAIFERVPKLLARIRATYQGGETTEYRIMKTLTDADLLVLDDAGAEKWSQWTEPTLYTIIDERYSWQKPLLITTNSDLEGLAKKIGSRAMDRVLEMCEIVENKGTSYRQRLAQQLKRSG